MPSVTICCSAEMSNLGSVGCGLLHQNPSVCVGVSLEVQGGDAAGQVPDLFHWWVNLNCTPKQHPSMLQQLRPADAELRPQAALV